MGTSTSYRAPHTPRWQAFTTALITDQPLERVRAELFNAGAEWERAIAAPGVAEFAAALAEASEVLPQRVAQAARPESAIREYVAEARSASADAGGSAAIALAERALTALLTRSAGQGQALAALDSQSAATHLAGALSNPGAAVVAYLGEILGQYARHVVAREAGRLTEGELGRGAAGSRKAMRAVAARAEDVARVVTPPTRSEAAAVRQRWSALVNEAFHEGRRLPAQGT